MCWVNNWATTSRSATTCSSGRLIFWAFRATTWMSCDRALPQQSRPRPTKDSVEESAGSLEALRLVAIAQAVDAHAAVGRWRVDEARVGDVDADVRQRAIQRVEENQVAGPQLVAGNRPAVAGDVGGAAGHLDAGCPAVDVADHAAAIQPGLRVLAAETVAGVEQAHGIHDHLVALVTDRARGLRYSSRRCFGARRRAAAGGEQQGRDDHCGQDGDAHSSSAFGKHRLSYRFLRIFQDHET